jgi:tetratricopeptide (TPR) repeat protein
MTTSSSGSSSSSSGVKVQQLVETAQTAAAAGDTAAAITGYRAALAVAPELPALWCELSAAYEAASKPAAAVAALECGLRAVSWRGGSAEAATAADTDGSSSSGSIADASKRSETALHLQLALLWQRLGSIERAVQCAGRACASGRGAPACEFVRAALLLQQQQQQQGDGVCKAAVEGFKRAASGSSSTSSGSGSGIKSIERLPVPAALLQLYCSNPSESEQ